MKPRIRLLFGLTGAAAAGVLALLLWPSKPSPAQGQDAAAPAAPPAVVEIAMAEQRSDAGESWLPASVVSRNDARLAGEVPGRLTFVAEVGTQVAAGDAVARVDDEALQLELRDADALVGRREAELRQAARQLDRLTALRESNLVSTSQLDEAEAAAQIRERELVQARVGRDRARQRLAQATVRAPYAGVVVDRLAQVGEYLQPGAAVARLVQTSQVELSARAPAALANTLSAGRKVAVRQGADTLQATVRAVIPAADQVSRQVELRLTLDDGHWLVGSAAEVALPQALASTGDHVVVAPRDALVMRPDGSYVFRIDADGIARRIAVNAGSVRDGWIEIDGDVQAGDRLVVRGAERLRDGQTVAVRGDDAPEASHLAKALAMTAG